MGDVLTSMIRTGVPMLVGAVVSYLATKGIHAPDAVVSMVTALLTFCFGYVYYLIVRYLEQKFPQAGYLLGTPVQPTYNN